MIKQDGAHSGLNSFTREQTLADIRNLRRMKTGGSVTQHHAEFKQLASKAKGDVGLFEVTLHRTVARAESEEVEIGETEKDNDQFLECPPCDEGPRLSAPCAGQASRSTCPLSSVQ